MRAKYWLQRFDPTAEFEIAKHHLTFGDKQFFLGDKFDKTLVSTRRLRQLYESRRLAMVEGTGAPSRVSWRDEQPANVTTEAEPQPIETVEEKAATEPAIDEIKLTEPETKIDVENDTRDNDKIDTDATKDLTQPSIYDSMKPTVEIVEARAGWLKVMVDGEQYGKATRERDEAERMADEWR